MSTWLQFQIYKAARRIELHSLLCKLQTNREKLLALVQRRSNKRQYKAIFDWINRSIVDVKAEAEIWKTAKNFDHLHELDIVRATKKMDQSIAEVSKLMGRKITIGESPELDEQFMKVLKIWEERIEN